MMQQLVLSDMEDQGRQLDRRGPHHLEVSSTKFPQLAVRRLTAQGHLAILCLHTPRHEWQAIICVSGAD